MKIYDSRTDQAGKFCPLCHSGKLSVLGKSTGILAGTVECQSCGAILPRYATPEDEATEIVHWKRVG